MNKQLELVKKFHEKFNAPILNSPQIPNKKRFEFRYKLMKEEIDEYLDACKNSDLTNIAKELADILFTVYGTILEHGLQDKMDEIFSEVYNSNMSKDYAEFKMIKGENYFKPDIKKFFEN